jgi:hypothetical protein
MVDKTEAEDDYEFSRSVYRALVERGLLALDEVGQVASETEHPRAYEVVANTMKQVSDVTDRLMELHKKKKEISEIGKAEAPKEIPNTTNNLFIGSTTELQKMLSDMSNNANSVVEEATIVEDKDAD